MCVLLVKIATPTTAPIATHLAASLSMMRSHLACTYSSQILKYGLWPVCVLPCIVSKQCMVCGLCVFYSVLWFVVCVCSTVYCE